jgi:hypothetical protein
MNQREKIAEYIHRKFSEIVESSLFDSIERLIVPTEINELEKKIHEISENIIKTWKNETADFEKNFWENSDEQLKMKIKVKELEKKKENSKEISSYLEKGRKIAEQYLHFP